MHAVRQMGLGLIEVGAIFTNETGFIAGMLTPLYFNPSVFVATEIAWWAPEGGGRELREAFEDWAREKGAVEAQCSALADENFQDVNRKYQAGGYQLKELTYLKRL